MISVASNCYYNVLKYGEVVYSCGTYDRLLKFINEIKQKEDVENDEYKIGIFNYISMEYEYLYGLNYAEQYIIEGTHYTTFMIDEEKINKTYNIKKQGVRCGGCKLVENNIHNYVDCKNCPLKSNGGIVI